MRVFSFSMSSTNEEIRPPSHHHHQHQHHQQQQGKTRVSPLEFRNTDLVSRLLAATPPYLYNMPLVPHTYFFSEMLRSFVQAKTDSREQATGGGGVPQMRNPQMLPQRRTRKRSWTNVNYHKHQETKDMPPPPTSGWTPKMYLDKGGIFDKPLELTTTNKHSEGEAKCAVPPLTFPTVAAAAAAADASQQQQDQMVLPPPPPLWYPPLYPPGTSSYPSAFDPLHFFIDLRVSGHIYDRKGVAKGDDKTKADGAPLSYFKQTRHCSAFSVPGNQTANGNFPMNLSAPNAGSGDVKMKFDVKSMGFDKKDACGNKTGSNYIMQNIDGIYKSINGSSYGAADDSVVVAVSKGEEDGRGESLGKDNVPETEEDKKKDKDLRALIGLELVVDYMSHRKKNVSNEERPESGSSSPAVEVVAITENDNFM